MTIAGGRTSATFRRRRLGTAATAEVATGVMTGSVAATTASKFKLPAVALCPNSVDKAAIPLSSGAAATALFRARRAMKARRVTVAFALVVVSACTGVINVSSLVLVFGSKAKGRGTAGNPVYKTQKVREFTIACQYHIRQ